MQQATSNIRRKKKAASVKGLTKARVSTNKKKKPGRKPALLSQNQLTIHMDDKQRRKLKNYCYRNDLRSLSAAARIMIDAFPLPDKESIQ